MKTEHVHSKWWILIVLLVFSLHSRPLYAQDLDRITERGIIGTARYVGFGGAMTAIGGDPSAVHDNPAGLGLYRRFEVLLSLDETIDKTKQVGASNTYLRSSFRLPHASLVFSFPSAATSDQGVQFNNLMLSFRRLQTYNRTYQASGTDGASLGALVDQPSIPWNIPFCTLPTNKTNSLSVREAGYLDEFAFDWSMNISNQWYVGAGVRVQSYSLSSNGDYYETFDSINAEGKALDIENETGLILSGVSCNLSAGIIYRPVRWLRLGLSMQTPSLGFLRTSTTGTFSARTDSVRFSYAPNLSDRDGSFHMPWRSSVSAAFQIGAYGMLALQYDYSHWANRDDVHVLKAGLEVIPVMGLYINAGYAYESSFQKTDKTVPFVPGFDRQDTYYMHPKWAQYASVAVGYRGAFFMIQAAYQYRWQRTNLYAHEAVTAPYDMRSDTHRIVITLGWHQY